MFLSIIVGIMIFIVGMVFINFIDMEVDTMLSEFGCGSVQNGNIVNQSLNLSDGAKATCMVAELVIPYFIVVVLAAAGGLIIARFII